MVRLTKKEKVMKSRIKLYNKWFDFWHIFPLNVWERKDIKTYLPKMLKKSENYIEKNYYGHINLNIYNAIKDGSDHDILTYYKDYYPK